MVTPTSRRGPQGTAFTLVQKARLKAFNQSSFQAPLACSPDRLNQRTIPPLSITNRPARGNGSAVVAIASRRIDTELINIMDDLRHRKAQAELVRIGISRVVQEIERKLVLVNHLLVLLWNLRVQRGKGYTQSFNVFVDCLQSIHSCIKVGSPNAAEHGQNNRSDGEQFRRFNRFVERVGQRESRQAIAHLDTPFDVRPG